MGGLRALVRAFRIGVGVAPGTITACRVVLTMTVFALHHRRCRCERDRCRVAVDARARGVTCVEKVHWPRMRLACGHRYRYGDALRRGVVLGAVAGCAAGLGWCLVMADGTPAWALEREATMSAAGLMTREARELRRVPRVRKAVGYRAGYTR